MCCSSASGRQVALKPSGVRESEASVARLSKHQNSKRHRETGV